MSPLPEKYRPLFEQARPFLIAAPHVASRLDTTPFGLPPALMINPFLVENRRFIERVQVMDRLAFGPRGLHMPQWIFFDGAAVTGAMFGLALPLEALSGQERQALELEEPAPPWVAISIYAAIPTHQPGAWMGHNLASLKSRLPGRPLQGLGVATKALGLKAFRAATQLGITQWGAGALHVHCRFGPLELLSGYTPAHTRPDSLTYRWPVDDKRLLAGLGGPAPWPQTAPTLWINGDDHAAMRALQTRLEAGERAFIPAPPLTEGAAAKVGVAFGPPPGR